MVFLGVARSRVWRFFVPLLSLTLLSGCKRYGALDCGARRLCQFLLMDTFSRLWRAISFPRSDTDCQSAQECLKRSLACISSIERCTGSLHFNHSLCERFVTKYVSRARELLDAWQSEIELYSEQCAPALTALHKTLNEAEFLIQKHCASFHWLWAAVELVENTSAFAEVILDLRWYTHALQIAIELSRGTSPRQSRRQKDLVWDLQKDAMKEHGDFLEGWERECKQLRLYGDREALLSKLKVGNGAEIRCLGSYLAQKLALRHMHAREALAVNLNVTELLHDKHLLGEGNYGKVYKVQWLGLPCALKQVNSSDVDEVVPEEVKILSKLHHPNIIQLYGYFFERGTLYLIMELMDDSLSEYVRAPGWSTLQSSPKDFLLVALDCMLQIAKGLRYLHSQGMAHRDLKGDNVLVKPSENPDRRSKGYLSVKLTDFGLAKANLKNSTYSSLDWKAGSLSWKAPELFRVGNFNNLDTSNVTPRRKNHPLKPDVYSFAIVCAEILCGTQPFPSAELQPRREFCAKVMGGELRPKLPEKILPPELADYIKRCWDTDPVNRPEFRDICKRIRHFRDSLLEVKAFVGWELKTQERKPIIQEPSAIDEDDFIDIPEGDWIIEYDDILHEERIHSGSGFLQVYRAQLNSKRVLAKHIEVTLVRNDDLSSSFKHEVKSLVRIRHPHLVYYLGVTRRPPYVVVTELAQGVTLRKFLNKTAPLSQLDAVHLALQVALGMARLHEDELGIIHGELSPDCILVDENTMTAKVLDFGLRRFRNEPNRHCFPRLFRRSPEQHLGLPSHTSVDVFAFGMILYDLLEYEKAQLFWKKKTASKKLQAGERPELGFSGSYPKGVHALVKRCWTHKWQERPDFESIVSILRKVDTDLQSNLLRSTSIVRTNSKDRHRV